MAPAQLELSERVLRFADELQARGVPLSTTERIDALRALPRVDLLAPASLPTALQATMIKSADHLAVFDEVYQLFFRAVAPSSSSPTVEPNAGSPGAGVPLDLDHALRSVLREGSEALARLVAEQAVRQFAQFEPGRPVAGYQYAMRTLNGLRLDQVGAELRSGSLGDGESGAEGGGAGGTVGSPNESGLGTDFFARTEAELISERVEWMRQLVREVIREMLVADRGVDAVAKTLRTPLPADVAISMATPAQLAEIDRLLQPLQRKLATTLMRKRRRRTGPLDVRATVRASMASGGVPLRIVNRRPTPTKPKLYVLADVSGSVATFAAFTLTVVSSMAVLYSRLRAFAFVENAVEVTHLFDGRRADPVGTLKAINQLEGLNHFDSRTDYGRTLRRFYEQVGEQLDRRSTVLIFGDARSNYRPAQDGTLAHIAHRAGAVYWLNPERVSEWGSGDSLMTVYAQLCTRAVSCRTLNDLRHFIETLE